MEMLNLNREMTRCSDKENEGLSDDGAEKSNENQKKRSKGEKRVSFPPDEHIVSGFAEQRSTDPKADSCLTLTEIMAAYQRNCSIHQVEPKPHILQQLQSVSLSRLDLCNVPIVAGPAQCISKALSSSRLTVLNLCNAQLSGVPLYTLVGALKTNRTLHELHLANNLLNSYQDALQLGDLLRYNNTLQTLELSNNVVADAGLEELCDGLKWQTTGLQVLLLRNNQITAKGMEHLARTLPVLKVLQVLDLGENLLGNEGIHVIRESLMVNCSVQQLSLTQANITCEGAVALAEFLVENHQIKRLDLRMNDVRLGGLMALSVALKINNSLVHLDLDFIPSQEQDEFLSDTQTRLQAEITQRCLINARLRGPAEETSETSTADAHGLPDNTTAA
ncbi:protein phosphatase 1 regulatory subunit 37 isoform X6 [Betta splendens]|uniref:Protein phosphatase 1 regulatory subunit 37 n=1 Tax=Betta splendens TaxID=158456 RepID=A0A6P7LKH3_BETSP|nr:protein phosphatase 1 regulatory subunit 37 isoform X6 [Betta splendens]